MQIITATALEQRLGACFERVPAEPLIVERSGCPGAWRMVARRGCSGVD